jgi:hypothetical protein
VAVAGALVQGNGGWGGHSAQPQSESQARALADLRAHVLSWHVQDGALRGPPAGARLEPLPPSFGKLDEYVNAFSEPFFAELFEDLAQRLASAAGLVGVACEIGSADCGSRFDGERVLRLRADRHSVGSRPASGRPDRDAAADSSFGVHDLLLLTPCHEPDADGGRRAEPAPPDAARRVEPAAATPADEARAAAEARMRGWVAPAPEPAAVDAIAARGAREEGELDDDADEPAAQPVDPRIKRRRPNAAAAAPAPIPRAASPPPPCAAPPGAAPAPGELARAMHAQPRAHRRQPRARRGSWLLRRARNRVRASSLAGYDRRQVARQVELGARGAQRGRSGRSGCAAAWRIPPARTRADTNRSLPFSTHRRFCANCCDDWARDLDRHQQPPRKHQGRHERPQRQNELAPRRHQGRHEWPQRQNEPSPSKAARRHHRRAPSTARCTSMSTVCRLHCPRPGQGAHCPHAAATLRNLQRERERDGRLASPNHTLGTPPHGDLKHLLLSRESRPSCRPRRSLPRTVKEPARISGLSMEESRQQAPRSSRPPGSPQCQNEPAAVRRRQSLRAASMS